MNRNTVRLLGLLFLVPSMFLGLMPTLAAHTDVLNGMPEFTWYIGDQLISEYKTDLNGAGWGTTWWGVWAVAVAAEVLLLGVTLFKPINRNRFKINIYG